MAVYVSNLVINSGVDFSQIFDLRNSANDIFSLSGCSVKSQMRKTPSSSSYYEFQVDVIDETEGKVRLSMGSTITSTIKSGRYVYDVLLTLSNTKKVITLEGTALVRTGISTGCF
jgi:hypothetical protein